MDRSSIRQFKTEDEFTDFLIANRGFEELVAETAINAKFITLFAGATTVGRFKASIESKRTNVEKFNTPEEHIKFVILYELQHAQDVAGGLLGEEIANTRAVAI